MRIIDDFIAFQGMCEGGGVKLFRLCFLILIFTVSVYLDYQIYSIRCIFQ